MEELSKALREEMDRRRHSLRQAAEVMGVASTTVNNWVKGWIVNPPKQKNLIALAGYLGVPPYVVYGWVDWLDADQVALLSTIPGSLTYANTLALAMVSRPGYLKPAVGAVLVAS